MSKLSAGKEIVTYCSKCKLDLGHVIVVMADELTPDRVQCNTCKATHKFKVKKVARKSTTPRKKRVSTEQKITNLWEETMQNFTGEEIPYSMKTKFEQGQILSHPKFGPGLVEKVLDSKKIEVVFRTTIKVLIHNKA